MARPWILVERQSATKMLLDVYLKVLLEPLPCHVGLPVSSLPLLLPQAFLLYVQDLQTCHTSCEHSKFMCAKV